MTAGGERDRASRVAALEHGLFAVLPVLMTAAVVYWVAAAHTQAKDFADEYWVAGARLLHGGGVYAWSHASIVHLTAFPYPALTAIVMVPFALVSKGVSEWLFVAVLMVSLAAALKALDVRDWRLYGLVLLWPPVVNAWYMGNVTLLLVLGLALVWRFRDRALLAGVLTAAMVSLKPFVWPVALWLLATRRYRAAAWSIAAGAAINAVAWTVLGFGQIGRFLHLSSEVTSALVHTGYGAVALGLHLGLTRGAASAAEVALSLVAALAMVWMGRRGRDDAALAVCVVLMLLASPLVWNHYCALIVVPMAIARPRLSRVWLAPLVLWVCPAVHVATWQILVEWVTVGGCAYALARRPAPAGASRPAVTRLPDTALAGTGAAS
jgi:hypothetical protein